MNPEGSQLPGSLRPSYAPGTYGMRREYKGDLARDEFPKPLQGGYEVFGMATEEVEDITPVLRDLIWCNVSIPVISIMISHL